MRTGRSRSAPSWSISPSASALPSFQAETASLTRRAVRDISASIVPVTVSAPKAPHSSAMRRAPRRVAPTCPRRSPSTTSGARLLLRTIASTSALTPSALHIRTGGTRIPSWKISRAAAPDEPGTSPPTSALCATLTPKATRFPSKKAGVATTKSGTWLLPAL